MFCLGTSESDTSSVEDLSNDPSPSSLYYPPAHTPRTRPLSLPPVPAEDAYPLHTYTAAGELEKLTQYLTSHKQADVNQQMKENGSTPLHIAAEYGQPGQWERESGKSPKFQSRRLPTRLNRTSFFQIKAYIEPNSVFSHLKI